MSNREEYLTVCKILDKLTLRQLYLMEEKLRCELSIESSINNGSIHLAKSRYIMGQNSVNITRLPVKNSPEFSATTICESVEEDATTQFKVVESGSKDTVNPLHWFGVLVPQNLHKAQSIFQNTINFVVECVNIQLHLFDTMTNIKMLKTYKNLIKNA